MSKTLDQIVSEAEQRLEEVEPFHHEYLAIEQFLAALGRDETPAEPPRARNRSTRRGRPVGSGNRHQEAMQLLSDHGPMTVNEIAEHMGIRPNYLYRMLPTMEERGLVTCADRRWVLSSVASDAIS